MASASYNVETNKSTIEGDICKLDLNDKSLYGVQSKSELEYNDRSNLLYDKNADTLNVKRRNKTQKTTLLDRLSKIISVYVPQQDEEYENGPNEKEQQMYNMNGPLPPQYTKDYVFQRLFTLDKLYCNDTMEDSGKTIDFDTNQINSLIFTEHHVFFTLIPRCFSIDSYGDYMNNVDRFEECHFLYKYKVDIKSILKMEYVGEPNDSEIDNRTSMIFLNNPVEKIRMSLNGLRFVPQNVMYNNAHHLFMTGFIERSQSQSEGVNASNKSFQNIMVISSLEGNILHYSRRYDNHRYGCLSGDIDGSIFVGNPIFDDHAGLSGVSKMKANFSRKSYVITLGSSGKTQYTPLYVAGHSINDQTWISCIRRDISACKSDKSERRLITFKCCLNDAKPQEKETRHDNETSFKDLIGIRSWNFENLNPGPLCTLDGKLLVINSFEHTLNYIVFDGDNIGKPKVVRVTKAETDKTLLGLTTFSKNAFMWSNKAVYRFCFRQEEVTSINETKSDTVILNFD